MNPIVNAARRDAIYEELLDRFSAIGDIEVAIRAENCDDAERIGRSYHLNQLGKVGALKVVRRRRVRGSLEKFYFFR
jgi:hypothetical protein